MNYYLEGTDSKPRQKKEKAMNTKLVIYLGELPPNVDQFELNQFILSQGKFNIESLYVKNAPETTSASKSSARYIMNIQLNTSETEKTADISFYDAQQNCLYQLSTAFPDDSRKDVTSKQ